MLTLHSCNPARGKCDTDLTVDSLPEDLTWIDLFEPTQEEISFVERVTKLRVPSQGEIAEIEASSRLRTEDGALYLSAPALYRTDRQSPRTTAVGFVLSAARLITVRYERLAAFQTFSEELCKPDRAHPSSTGMFVGLLEAVVDRAADTLERIAAELDTVSHRIFHPEEPIPDGADAGLRDMLQMVGRTGDLLSKIRDGLLGVGRLVPYVQSRAASWLPSDVHARLDTLKLDVTSLNDYDAYLAAKVQFLLDATLGLINVEQNDVIKVLTIVSVVGIGPTLVASWYGMNFHHIPELDWAFGYPYVIVLAAVTAVAPLLWFKARRWF